MAGTNSVAGDVVASTTIQHIIASAAIYALDDLRDHFGREPGIAGQLVHQRLALAFAEPVERHTRDVGAPGPGRLEFQAKRNRQQYRQIPHPVYGQIQ